MAKFVVRALIEVDFGIIDAKDAGLAIFDCSESLNDMVEHCRGSASAETVKLEAIEA